MMRSTSFVLAMIFLTVFTHDDSAFAAVYLKDTAEELFWQSPATLHDYKNRSDLHNRAAAILAITELEFTRLGDLAISAARAKKVRPLESAVDSIGTAYEKIPQVRPVLRLGELVDAVQIPELSLSDARSIILISGGSNNGLISPIMQERIYKLLVWVEDIIYDVDDLIMLPVNYPLEKIRGEESDLQTVGYVGVVVGSVRSGLFTGIRTIGRYVIRFSSSALKKVEGAANVVVRAKRKRSNADYPIYARVPYEVYADHLSYFKKNREDQTIGTRDSWKKSLEPGIELSEWVLKGDRERPPISITANEDVFLMSHAGAWRDAPKDLLQYVITEGEFEDFLR